MSVPDEVLESAFQLLYDTVKRNNFVSYVVGHLVTTALVQHAVTVILAFLDLLCHW